jgi:hypothetical protein
MSILTVLSIAGLYAIAGHRLRRLRATLGQAQSGNEFIEHRAWNNVGRLLVGRFDLRSLASETRRPGWDPSPEW